MNCPHCNAQLEAGWKVCPYCEGNLATLGTMPDVSIQDSAIKDFTQNNNQAGGASMGGNIIINIASPDSHKTHGIGKDSYKNHVSRSTKITGHEWHGIEYHQLPNWVKTRIKELNQHHLYGKTFEYRKTSADKFQKRLRSK